MFIFAADLHLSKITFRACPEVTYEGIQALEELLELCGRYNCPLVLGGDVWDSNQISAELFQKVQEVYARHNYRETYFINGNHDSVHPNWLSLIHPNIKHLGQDDESFTLTSQGDCLSGLDYTAPQNLDKALQRYRGLPPANTKYFHYLITHQYINLPSIFPSGVDPELYAGFDHVLAGDIHLPLHHGNIWYPGCASRRAYGEPRGHALICDGDSICYTILHTRRAGYLYLPETDVVDYIQSFNWETDVKWEDTLEDDSWEIDPYSWLFVDGLNLTNAQILLLKKRISQDGWHFQVVPHNRTQGINTPMSEGSLVGHNGLEYAVSAVQNYEAVTKEVRDATVHLLQNPEAFQKGYTYAQ